MSADYWRIRLLTVTDDELDKWREMRMLSGVQPATAAVALLDEEIRRRRIAPFRDQTGASMNPDQWSDDDRCLFDVMWPGVRLS
jgi:hypothetical protein